MSAKTSIEWTDKTWNPTRGCSRVSAGCDHCYAMREARRHDHEDGAYQGLTRIGKRGVDWSGRVAIAPDMLDHPLTWRKPQRVFVNSMSDLFHEALPAEDIKDVFDIMALADHHTFQILTKRPRRMRDLLARGEVTALGAHPLPNVWLGVSVEDQVTADERIPLLLQTPAAVRFISYEPALAGIDIAKWLRDVWACNKCGHVGVAAKNERSRGHAHDGCNYLAAVSPALDWVIVGGESGPGARPFDVSWARSTVAQCKAAGVACFVKQLGRCPTCAPEERQGTEVGLDAATKRWTLEAGRPVLLLKDRKGGDMAEWPEDLRVREFPAVDEAARRTA